MSRNEAKDLIDEYFKTFAGIKRFTDSTVASCRANGYVSTMFGHRRYLSDINSRNVNVRAAAERLAVNTVIQGTAAAVGQLLMLAIGIWVIIEICTVKKDGQDLPFK